MIISEINDKNSWEYFVGQQRPDTFLHSWNWGEFNKAMGYKIFRFAAYDDTELKAVGLFIKIIARRATYLLCPHGPISQNFDALNSLIEHAKMVAGAENCHFLRICPLLRNTTENKRIFKDRGFRNSPIHTHPELSWILEITKPEEELLKEMRKTTRYSIKKAIRDRVDIIKNTDQASFEEFWRLYQKTASRQQFSAFSKKYLQAELDAFKNDNQILIFTAKYHNEITSTAMIIFQNDSAFYHQGASIQKDQITASYLLQWEAILEAKKRGCAKYNFWGVAPENRAGHPWAGLSLFKKGFGGYYQNYVRNQDYVLSPFYYVINFLIESVRRLKRGY